VTAPRHRRLVLAIVVSDTTFAKTLVRGATCFVGKCIHCNSKLVVEEDGSAASGVTIEHIVPKNHGGGDDVENLALACARCNGGKGIRLDHLKPNDPRARAVIDALLAKRRARMPTARSS
jgi:5-methylcytosine-specific restriction endonuclease McrA